MRIANSKPDTSLGSSLQGLARIDKLHTNTAQVKFLIDLGIFQN